MSGRAGGCCRCMPPRSGVLCETSTPGRHSSELETPAPWAAARAPFCLQCTPRPPGPRQVITTTEHLKQFLASEAAKDFVGWVLALNEAVKGRPLSDTCHVSAGRRGRGGKRESGRKRLLPVSLLCSGIDSGRAGSTGMMVCRF